jgi:hypothetical protein
MMQLRGSIRQDLDGLFSEAALIRGRAVDMIEEYAVQHERRATALRGELDGYVVDLRRTVARLLGEYAKAREAMGASAVAARGVHLKIIRDQVMALVAETSSFLDRLDKERMQGRRAWNQRVRHARRQLQRVTGRPAPAAKEATPTALPKVVEKVVTPAEAPKAVAKEPTRTEAPKAATYVATPIAAPEERIRTEPPKAAAHVATPIAAPKGPAKK